MSFKFLQANVNMSKPSLDLLVHHAKETEVNVLLISEPNYIPTTTNWYASKNNKAPIYIDPSRLKFNCKVIRAGSQFIAIHYGPYLVVSIYAPPSLKLREFNNLLDELSEALSHRVSKIILGGDFNSKSSLWGSNITDRRGVLLSRWAGERDLRVANIGENPTCVRPQGTSIVDLTWVSSDLIHLVKNWKVEEDIESLSDHLYISFDIDTGKSLTPSSKTLSRKWNYKRFDKDLFVAVLVWRGLGPAEDDLDNLDAMIN